MPTTGILHARARFDGPDHHDLPVRYENDYEFAFRTREQMLDGTLVPVSHGDVEMVLRTNPRSPLAEGCAIAGSFVGDDNVALIRLPYASLAADAVHFQLDIIRDGWRTTFAAGTIRKTGE